MQIFSPPDAGVRRYANALSPANDMPLNALMRYARPGSASNVHRVAMGGLSQRPAGADPIQRTYPTPPFDPYAEDNIFRAPPNSATAGDLSFDRNSIHPDDFFNEMAVRQLYGGFRTPLPYSF